MLPIILCKHLNNWLQFLCKVEKNVPQAFENVKDCETL